MSQAGKLRDGTALAALETLTGDSGGAVPGSGSPANIDILGTAGQIVVTGTPGTSTLQLSLTGTHVAWSSISASQTMVNGEGYICSGGGDLDLALPATASVGEVIYVVLDGATSFSITQAAGQQIRFGNTTTTLGATGELVSSAQGDSIQLLCIVADTKWIVLHSIGNLTPA